MDERPELMVHLGVAEAKGHSGELVGDSRVLFRIIDRGPLPDIQAILLHLGGPKNQGQVLLVGDRLDLPRNE